MLKGALLTVSYLALFNYAFYRFKKIQLNGLKPLVTLGLFNIKFVTGIFIWLVYTFYYKDVQNNDVHKFYTDALVLKQAAVQAPASFTKLMLGLPSDSGTAVYETQMHNWVRNFDEAPFNENRTVIRLNALLLFLSFNTYFVHVLFMCFFSLVGWVLMVNAVFTKNETDKILLAVLVLLLPSVLFWASGVMKEPLLVLGLGLIIHGVFNNQNRPLFRNLVSVTAGTLIVLMAKFFVLVCFVPAAIAFFLFRKKQATGFIVAKYLVINTLLLILAFNIYRVSPRVNMAQMLVNKQTHSIKEAEYFNAGSRIQIPAVSTNAASILAVAPVGIWNTIARPYPWEGRNVMMLASAAENLLVIAFIIVCFWLTYWKAFQNLNMVMFMLNFTLGYFALIGICTPVLGNLARYRAPLLPLLLFALLLNAGFKIPYRIKARLALPTLQY
ncbi:MAG TPA: hypothetical protein VG603_02200 [Chitinophagales bacterium]|nr:hypothetical protein [Chitinophagales bacterium]